MDIVEKDSAWKEAIETYFPDFLKFFFSDIARDIDFEKGYEFLDKELERIVQDAEIGRRLADILVKVYLEDGSEKWLLIHIEVQGYFEEELGKKFHEEIVKYEEEKKMPYITTAERIGMEKGIQQGIKQGIQQGIKQGMQQGIRQGLLTAIKLGLELKFGAEGLKIYPDIRKIEDVDVLEAISEAIKSAKNIEELREIYKDR